MVIAQYMTAVCFRHVIGGRSQWEIQNLDSSISALDIMSNLILNLFIRIVYKHSQTFIR